MKNYLDPTMNCNNNSSDRGSNPIQPKVIVDQLQTMPTTSTDLDRAFKA